MRESGLTWRFVLYVLPRFGSTFVSDGRKSSTRPPWSVGGRPHARDVGAHVAQGTVKWFNATKGYGFITPQDGGKDVFVHITAVQAAGLRGLNDGQKVNYDVAMERGKAAATNLKLA